MTEHVPPPPEEELEVSEAVAAGNPDMTALINEVTHTMMSKTVHVDTGQENKAGTEPERTLVTRYPQLHPYTCAEDIPPQIITEHYTYYNDGSLGEACHKLELMLSVHPSDPGPAAADITRILDDLYESEFTARRFMGQVSPNPVPGEGRWFDAAMLRAAMPAFVARAAHNALTPAVAKEVYTSIVKDIIPLAASAGRLGEAIIAALGARLGASGLCFPATSREERSRYISDTGRSYNHDLYRIVEDTLEKIPMQVKVSRRPGPYDERIVRVFIMQLVAPVIMGAGWKKTHPHMVKDSTLFLEHLRAMLHNPSDTDNTLLNMAALRVDSFIREAYESKGAR